MAVAAFVASAGILVVSGSRADQTSSTATHASSPTTVPVSAAVDAMGVARVPPDGWAVRRAGPGTYELTFDHDVRIDLGSWEAPADVTMRPVGDRRWTIAFEADGAPVDTAFTFRAAPLSR
jgi:hypothetical protein